VALVIISLLAAGCGGDKSLVALSARVDQPTLTAESSSVGADISGGFSLGMALGEYAADDTMVALGTFSVARDGMDLLSPLALAGAKFPVSLGVGKKVTLPLTFTANAEPSMADDICQAPVVLRGTLTDSLSNEHPTDVESAPFSATCQ
jgi:hypothetical protein